MRFSLCSLSPEEDHMQGRTRHEVSRILGAPYQRDPTK